MSIKTKYLKEEDIKKFDNFIQEALDKYFYVNFWDELISNTGKDSYDIISYKSTIPDLIIYNKAFNKNDCFVYSNKNNNYIKFPRVQFLLRPKKFKHYNPQSIHQEIKKENYNSENNKIIKTFEFKSIPKEIEEKYNKKDVFKNKENNLLLNELTDFMKNENENETDSKIKIINEQEKEIELNGNLKIIDRDNKNRDKIGENSNNNMNCIKNKFGTPFNFNHNNNFIYQKVKQNFHYQIYLNKMFSEIYLKSHANNILNPIKNDKKQMLNNQNNNKIMENNLIKTNNENENNKSKNYNTISYYHETCESDIQKFEKLINNMDEIFKKNKNIPGWKVIDIRKNVKINEFNNEQLYYFLKTITERNEDKFYSISNLEFDILFNPIKIYDELKKIYQSK